MVFTVHLQLTHYNDGHLQPAEPSCDVVHPLTHCGQKCACIKHLGHALTLTCFHIQSLTPVFLHASSVIITIYIHVKDNHWIIMVCISVYLLILVEDTWRPLNLF